MDNAGDDAIIGWAYDGYPIYGHNNPDGSAIKTATLDVCNGQTDNTFGYRYHTSKDAPYIIQCLMGRVDHFDKLPRVAPLKAARGGKGPDNGRPPSGGVSNLVFTQASSGRRSMDYQYQGQDYYIRYSPAGQDNCYSFESRTVTNSGVVKSGVYCR